MNNPDTQKDIYQNMFQTGEVTVCLGFNNIFLSPQHTISTITITILTIFRWPAWRYIMPVMFISIFYNTPRFFELEVFQLHPGAQCFLYGLILCKISKGEQCWCFWWKLTCHGWTSFWPDFIQGFQHKAVVFLHKSQSVLFRKERITTYFGKYHWPAMHKKIIKKPTLSFSNRRRSKRFEWPWRWGWLPGVERRRTTFSTYSFWSQVFLKEKKISS